MSEMLRAALVGCGPRGIEHARALQQVSGVALAGICDRDPAVLAPAIRALGVPGYSSLAELCERTTPHLVIVATPPQHRLALVKEAVEFPGVRAVVVKKPMALSLAHAHAMVAACTARNILCVVCHQLRHAPEFLALNQAIDHGQGLAQRDPIVRPALTETGAYEITALPDDALVGFHALETFQGAAFRWTGPVAALPLALPADAYEMTLDTRGLDRAQTWRTLHVTLEGRAVPCEIDEGCERLRCRFTIGVNRARARHRLARTDVPTVATMEKGPTRRARARRADFQHWRRAIGGDGASAGNTSAGSVRSAQPRSEQR